MTDIIVNLKPLNLQFLQVRLQGITGLITHAWSEKAKKQMLDKQQKKNLKVKEIRDPEVEYESGFYHFPGGGYGFPSTGIKGCLIGMAHKDYGVEKTLVRKAIYIDGEPDKNGMQLVKINGEPKMREDMVVIGMGSSDLRYRPEFMPWYMDISIKFNADLITPDSIINLLNLAGFGIGLGEWRPEKSGQSGMFEVANS